MLRGTLLISYISLVIAALTLSSELADVGFIFGIPVTILVSVAWGIFIWRKWNTGCILCMLILVLEISLTTILDGSQLILLISLLATLTTWDLATFYIRLSSNKHIVHEELLIRSHLKRLVGVILLGLALPLLAYGLQLDLQFWQVFLLGILLLTGLSQVFSQLKRSSSN